MQVSASAPGKAIISGEYAVLSGSAALSMALNRRAVVSVGSIDSPANSVVAPGYIDSKKRFQVADGGRFEWLDELPSPDAFRLFEAVWRRSGLAGSDNVSVSLDSRSFIDAASGRKLGIGSSAALAVAMAGAFRVLSGSPDSAYNIAMDAHRTFQDGKGSGVDVATAFCGGTIGYRLNTDCQASKIPDGLHYRFYWSGRSASTSGKIERLADSKVADVDSALAAASERMLDVSQDGSAGDFLNELKAYIDVLADFDREHELGIFAAGHRLLTEHAQLSGGLAYKPCGAGGGDIGVAIARSSSELDAFTPVAAGEGFAALDTCLEPRGVLVEAG